jgi:hypothetical protein
MVRSKESPCAAARRSRDEIPQQVLSRVLEVGGHGLARSAQGVAPHPQHASNSGVRIRKNKAHFFRRVTSRLLDGRWTVARWLGGKTALARAAPPARRSHPPARPAVRRSAPCTGAGQASQERGGERRRGALGGRPREGRVMDDLCRACSASPHQRCSLFGGLACGDQRAQEGWNVLKFCGDPHLLLG